MNDRVRWLTDSEQQVWRDYLAATSMLSAHLEHRLQEEAGMPHAYYAVLVELSEAPEQTLRMSELAERARFSRSRLSHAVAKMENGGWVVRNSCPTDRRGAFVTLTEAGMAKLKAAAPGHVEGVREALFDVLTDDQVTQLGLISKAIVANLGPACEKAAERELDDG